MIPRSAFVEQLKSLGYVFKTQTVRIQVWKKQGGTHRVEFHHKDFLDKTTVSNILRQCGVDKASIDAFLGRFVN